MYVRFYHTLILLILLTAGIAGAADPPKVYLRPCGGDPITVIDSNTCFAGDQWGAQKGMYIPPNVVTSYILGELNGQVSPAFHNHSTATLDDPGFMSARDRLIVSSFAPNNIAEGAVATGSWTSLSSAGYSVADTQSLWPYATDTGQTSGTHLVQTEADLSLYGVDWLATRNAVNRSRAEGLFQATVSGDMIFERPLILDSYDNLIAVGPASIAPKEGTFTTTDGTLSLAANSYRARVIGITFAETEKSGLGNGVYGQYTAIKVAAGANNYTIADCRFNNVQRGTWIVPPSSDIDIATNRAWQAKHLVYVDNPASPGWISGDIRGNRFQFNYRAGYSAMVAHAANAANIGLSLAITGNRTSYARLFDWQILNGSDSLFVRLNDNIVIGNDADNTLPLIRLVTKGQWDTQINGNILWLPNQTNKQPPVWIGGLHNVDVKHNQFGHAQGAVLRILSPVLRLHVAANEMEELYGNSIISGLIELPAPSIDFDGGGIETGVTDLYLSANAVPCKPYSSKCAAIQPAAVYNTDMLTVSGDVRETWRPTDATSNTPLTADTVMVAADSSTTIVRLPTPTYDLAPWPRRNQRYKIINLKTSPITATAVSADGTTTINQAMKDAAGTIQNTLTVPAASSIEVMADGLYWRQFGYL